MTDTPYMDRWESLYRFRPDCRIRYRFRLNPLRYVLAGYRPDHKAWLMPGQEAAMWAWLQETADPELRQANRNALYGSNGCLDCGETPLPIPCYDIRTPIRRALARSYLTDNPDHTVWINVRHAHLFFPCVSHVLRDVLCRWATISAQLNPYHPDAREFYGVEAVYMGKQWMLRLKYGCDGSSWREWFPRSETDDGLDYDFPMNLSDAEYDAAVALWLHDNLVWGEYIGYKKERLDALRGHAVTIAEAVIRGYNVQNEYGPEIKEFRRLSKSGARPSYKQFRALTPRGGSVK